MGDVLELTLLVLFLLGVAGAFVALLLMHPRGDPQTDWNGSW